MPLSTLLRLGLDVCPEPPPARLLVCLLSLYLFTPIQASSSVGSTSGERRVVQRAHRTADAASSMADAAMPTNTSRLPDASSANADKHRIISVGAVSAIGRGLNPRLDLR